MTEMRTKVCSRCQADKALELFTPSKRGLHGRASICKACKADEAREKYRNDPDAASKAREVRSKRRDAYNGYHRKWQERQKQLRPEWYIWNRAKRRARELGLPFDLQVEDVVIPQCCPILGMALMTADNGIATDNSPSLDRIVPALGYIKGNVIVVSQRANRIKNDANIDELEAIVNFYKESGREHICPAPKPNQSGAEPMR